MNIQELQNEIHQWAVQKGWWDRERGVPELLMLVVSEVSEALECWRNRQLESWKLDHDEHGVRPGKPEGFASELSDIIIRVLDIAAHYKIDLEVALREKMDYNYTRPYRHGNKYA